MRLTFILILLTLASSLHAETAAPAPLSPEDGATLRRIAAIRERLGRESRAAHPGLRVTDQNKSAGIIAELLNRAEQNLLHLLPPARFGWSWAGFDPPAEMAAHAESLLDILASGRDPFAGKYAEPGGYTVDHALIEKDGLHHLFYIRGTAVGSWPEYPLFNFGHAVSKDLVHWQTEDPVLQCPKDGWDTFQVWAPFVIERSGTYHMFYTGVNQNVSQAICHATSTDLYHWRRNDQNPVIKPGPWGTWTAEACADCRDPMVLHDGGKYFLYYTAARVVPETKQPESCIGVASSDDLLTWKDEGFIRLTESLTTPPESPFVLKRGGKYYLFYSNYKHGTVYAVSDDPIKGWKELPPDEMTLMGGVSASEIYCTGDQWHLSYISHQKNCLHFFEICRLRWDNEGRPSADLSTRETSVAESFGKAMRGSMKVAGSDEFRQRPVTVECMTKLDSAASYNVLVACDTKASAEHWSLYTIPGSGFVSLFQPGRGGEVFSETNICDGKWHAVAAVIEPDRVRLFVDGQLVKDAPSPQIAGSPLPGKLAFGDIVEGGLGCHGLVDNVRLSRGARDIRTAPITPLLRDDSTLGVWDFDELQ